MTDKDLLRKKYKELRKTLSFEEIEEKSMHIANQVLQLPIWDLQNFHLFLSIEKQKEINTEYLLHILLGKDKNVVVSKSDFNTGAMEHFLLTDNTVLKTNAFGIPEPVNGISFPTKNIDVVFVPLLAYDTFGNRIGYGKGFYDRFLSQCRTDCIKIGLSFFEPEKESFVTDSQDIPLDYGVSTRQWLKFNR